MNQLVGKRMKLSNLNEEKITTRKKNDLGFKSDKKKTSEKWKGNKLQMASGEDVNEHLWQRK